jgi:hypothetical protein
MRSLSLLVLLVFAPANATEMVIREFQGIGRAETEIFMARSPWLVEWHSVPPTVHDTKPSYLEVHLYDASTNLHVGRVVQRSGWGRGDVLIERSGRFRLVVQGQATDWRLRVIQVDDAYAERLKEAQVDEEPRRPRR